MMSIMLVLKHGSVVGARRGRLYALIREGVGIVACELDIARLVAVSSMAVVGFVAVEEEAEDCGEEEQDTVINISSFLMT